MVFNREFRVRALAVLTLGLIFGAGFGIGLAVERNLIAGTPSQEAADQRRGQGGDSGDDRREEEARNDARDEDRDDDGPDLIVHRVGLTPEQKVLVDQAAEEYFARVRELAAEKREVDRQFNERSRLLIEQGRAAIMEYLTEEQSLEYERLLQRWDDRRRDRRNRDRDDGRDRDDRRDHDDDRDHPNDSRP